MKLSESYNKFYEIPREVSKSFLSPSGFLVGNIRSNFRKFLSNWKQYEILRNMSILGDMLIESPMKLIAHWKNCLIPDHIFFFNLQYLRAFWFWIHQFLYFLFLDQYLQTPRTLLSLGIYCIFPS